MISRLRATAVIAALVTGLGIGLLTPVQADVPESSDPVKIALFDWTSVNLNAHIYGDILQRYGYNVEYIPADLLSSLTTGFPDGDLTVALEIWDTTAKEALEAAWATGKVEDLGKLGPPAIEEWWYPSYMKERCPGLPDWKALQNPDCAKAFSTADTAPDGRYLGAPVSWGGNDEERVKALGLPFQVIHAGTDAAMFAELDSAYQRKAPIVMWMYSPSWAAVKYKGEWVEFPPWTEQCVTDPSWGSNPNMLYDCGKHHGDIYKPAWSGMKDKWPLAYKIAKAYTMDTETLGKLATEVDIDGRDLEAVAKAWVDANESVWRGWAAQ